MKKNLLVLIIVFLSLKTFSQFTDKNYNFAIGMGASFTQLDVGKASPAGILIDMDFLNVHFDIASNFASGKGDYLEYSSSETTKADKQSWMSINFGYVFDIKNNWSIVPKLGFVILEDIWEDPILWNTYYKESAGTKMQIGAEIRKKINNLYLKAGSSTTEVFSFGVGFVI